MTPISAGKTGRNLRGIHHADTTIVSSDDRDRRDCGAVAAFGTGGLARVQDGGAPGRGCIRGRSWLTRNLLARDSAGLHARPHHHQSEQRRLLARARASCTRRSSATWTSRTRRRCTTCGRSSSRTSKACGAGSPREFGCDPEELAITRNASEALQIAQLGIDLKPGDEVVTTNQDYGRMLDTWDQRVRRDGIASSRSRSRCRRRRWTISRRG